MVNGIKVRESRTVLDNGLVFINEFWTCLGCRTETSSVEWFLVGQKVNGGYQVVHTCPTCKADYELVI